MIAIDMIGRCCGLTFEFSENTRPLMEIVAIIEIYFVKSFNVEPLPIF